MKVGKIELSKVPLCEGYFTKEVTEVMEEDVMEEDYDCVFRNHFSLQRRTIYLRPSINSDGDSIDDESASLFVKAFDILDKEGGVITVQIVDNYGGTLSSAMAIYDTIVGGKSTVIVIGRGTVRSSGVIVLLAGHVRVMTPNCNMLIHKGDLQISDTIQNIQAMSHELKNIDNFFKGLLANSIRSLNNRDESEVRSLVEQLYTNSDVWITAQQALEYGLITAIGVR